MEKTLPLSVSLQDELARALRRQRPLVVMVSLPGCPFCKVARENYLIPMQAETGTPVVQIDMRSHAGLRDFGGRATTHGAMARHWAIRIVPTVLFFGAAGAEVAERLVGAYIPDFYGAYLDQRVTQARAALR